MLSNCIKEISWVLLSQRVFSANFGKRIDFQFLRWLLSHYYNHEMNDNDVANQLCLIYRMMRLQ